MATGCFGQHGVLQWLRARTETVPADLGRLHEYQLLVIGLLAERASELEPSWELACTAAEEIAALQKLEVAVARKAASIRARDLQEVLIKLAIWEGVDMSDPADEEGGLRDRLVESVRRDLVTIAAARPGPTSRVGIY